MCAIGFQVCVTVGHVSMAQLAPKWWMLRFVLPVSGQRVATTPTLMVLSPPPMPLTICSNAPAV